MGKGNFLIFSPCMFFLTDVDVIEFGILSLLRQTLYGNCEAV